MILHFTNHAYPTNPTHLINLISMDDLKYSVAFSQINRLGATKIELLKRLIRIAGELNIIQNNKYLELESDLQEISKMTNGWIKYLTTAR